MKKQLVFHEKAIDINLSDSARLQSGQLASILIIEIQVYFSCLLGKRLAFYSNQAMAGVWQLDSRQFSQILQQSQALTDNIYIRFNTVMTKNCQVSDYSGPPPVTDFKIKNLKPYVPSWLTIDFNNNEWHGEYGWSASQAGVSNTRQLRGNPV